MTFVGDIFWQKLTLPHVATASKRALNLLRPPTFAILNEYELCSQLVASTIINQPLRF